MAADTQLNSRNHMAFKQKVKIWQSALALDPSWNIYEKNALNVKENFMKKTLLLCLKAGKEADTMRSAMVAAYTGDDRFSLRNVKEGNNWDGLYQVFNYYFYL